MGVTVAIVGAVIAAAVVVWFFVNRKNPETASSHGAADRRTTDQRVHDDPGGRPAGPGAEDERVIGPGETGPGPSAEFDS